MGFFKKLLGLEEEEVSEEIKAARERHNIKVEEPQQLNVRRNSREDRDERDEYDAWEELRNIRTNFFLGSWASRRYRRLTHNDNKLKEELERVAKEREEKERRKEERRRENLQ